MAKKTNSKSTKPKVTNNQESSVKSNGKKVDTYERIIKIDVLPEVVGSSCHHGRGDDCSVDRRKLDRTQPPHETLNLDKAHLMRALKNMMQARHTDEKHLTLVKQGKSFFILVAADTKVPKRQLPLLWNQVKIGDGPITVIWLFLSVWDSVCAIISFWH